MSLPGRIAALPRLALFLFTGSLMIAAGLPVAYGGWRLLHLGGSAYYLPTGIILATAGALILVRRNAGVSLYLALYAFTLVWALWEVGLDFWKLAPRIVAPTVLAILALLCASIRNSGPAGLAAGKSLRSWSLMGAGTLALGLGAFGAATLRPHNAIYNMGPAGTVRPSAALSGGDWTSYGRTLEGKRFAPFTQIDAHNVAQLEVAWTAHSGDIPGAGAADENTPLQIGTRLITCSPHNIVHALDVDTGAVLWAFDAKADAIRPRCRSVGYFRDDAVPAPGNAGGDERPCRERIVIATISARLIELDLVTGQPCRTFGTDGTVDLTAGLGEVPESHYFLTSAPTVTHGLIIVGGTVIDSASVDAPSGVVRAFDARTGALRWYWDLGRTEDVRRLPASPSLFTRGTPNVWAPPAVDEKLGLVFLPMGNPSPDHWGGKRTPAMEKFGSALVALDVETGRLRWSFQTVHHDLWDYDVASQPTLHDVPDGRGGRVPAVIQPTKRGEIFVLDRRTGKPVAPVKELPVPGGAASGDWVAPAQPYSVGMPTISGGRLTEADMWGLSPLDQLWCRIEFRKTRYDGDFTPPGTRASLIYPGVFGGMNWGGASVDEKRDYLIVNDIRLAQKFALVPRAVADRESKAAVLARFGARDIKPGHGGLMLQKGTPFAALYFNFMSPLNVPCTAPPYGTLTAIDLKTRQIAWQVPMGTTRDAGPLGIALGLPIPIGLPTIGGSLVTGSGLVFFAGTQDFYLRAIDSATGREVWAGRMPLGSGATPMTYVSPRTGRQYIVIAASGARDSPIRGDRIIAYALPEGKGRHAAKDAPGEMGL